MTIKEHNVGYKLTTDGVQMQWRLDPGGIHVLRMGSLDADLAHVRKVSHRKGYCFKALLANQPTFYEYATIDAAKWQAEDYWLGCFAMALRHIGAE